MSLQTSGQSPTPPNTKPDPVTGPTLPGAADLLDLLDVIIQLRVRLARIEGHLDALAGAR